MLNVIILKHLKLKQISTNIKLKTLKLISESDSLSSLNMLGKFIKNSFSKRKPKTWIVH